MITEISIKRVANIMTSATDEVFEVMKLKLNENILSVDDLKNRFTWVEVLDKMKETFKVTIEAVVAGAKVLFVDGKHVSLKWYNIAGLLKLYQAGRILIGLITDVYKIWSE